MWFTIFNWDWTLRGFRFQNATKNETSVSIYDLSSLTPGIDSKIVCSFSKLGKYLKENKICKTCKIQTSKSLWINLPNEDMHLECCHRLHCRHLSPCICWLPSFPHTNLEQVTQGRLVPGNSITQPSLWNNSERANAN